MTETISWVDVDATEHDLTDQADVKVLRGPTGRFMPPIALVTEVVPLAPGARLRDIRHDVREVMLPLRVMGSTATEARTALRAFCRRFDPVRGDGHLRVTAPGGDRRELTCRYVGGMEVDEVDGLQTYRRASVVFHAFDPYWYDVSDRVRTYETGEEATFFPLFPLRLSSSEVFADATEDNDGDVEAWPVWTITGPGSGPVLRNLTTGKHLSLTHTLAAGDVVVVDTRPGVKTITDEDGTNLYSTRASGSALWSLATGSNTLRIELSSATDATSVRMTYRRGFLSA